MKKFIAVSLCVIMMLTMIPTFFASASDSGELTATTLGTSTTSTTSSTSGTDIISTFKGFIELWSGLWNTVIGSDVADGFLPALKQLLNIFSFTDLFENLGQLWDDIVKA